MPSFRESVQATTEAMKAGNRAAAKESVSAAIVALGDSVKTVSVGGYGELDCAMAIGSFVSIRVMGEYVAMELRDPSGFPHRLCISAEQIKLQSQKIAKFWTSFTEAVSK